MWAGRSHKMRDGGFGVGAGVGLGVRVIGLVIVESSGPRIAMPRERTRELSCNVMLTIRVYLCIIAPAYWLPSICRQLLSTVSRYT